MNGAEAAHAAAHLAALDRRGFLRLVGLAAGAGLLPAGCRSAPEAYAPPPDLALRVLTPRGYAVLTAAAERVVGGEAFIELEGGCVCCELSDDLVNTLQRLYDEVRPDRIVIETSGAALPIAPRFRPNSRNS